MYTAGQHVLYIIGNMFVLELLLDYKIHRFINTKKKYNFKINSQNTSASLNSLSFLILILQLEAAFTTEAHTGNSIVYSK